MSGREIKGVPGEAFVVAATAVLALAANQPAALNALQQAVEFADEASSKPAATSP